MRKRLPDGLGLTVAEQLGGGAIERLDHPSSPSGDDPVRHVVEHRPRPRLAVAELVAEACHVASDCSSSRDLRNSSTKTETFARRMSGDDRREDEVDGAALVGDRDLGLVARRER